MIKRKFRMFLIAVVSAALLSCQPTGAEESRMIKKIDENFEFARKQYLGMIDNMETKNQVPRSVKPDGSTYYVKPVDWTSGFFGGSLFYIYEATGDEEIKKNAIHFTEYIAIQQWDSTQHDTGFQVFCSFGNGLRLLGNEKEEEYKQIIYNTSNTLCSRYNETIGAIRSWDFGDWDFPVIIDNMMNLELLYWAGKNLDEPRFIYIANRHALVTIENHFRDDYSSVHVVDYCQETGGVHGTQTFQGLHDDSAWSRGQAWGLYGSVMSYRETGKEVFLDQAKNIAALIISKLPDDYIPFWDFDLPSTEGEPRDASTAAITASALIELYQFTQNEEYKRIATEMLKELMSPNYRAELGQDNWFLLRHSTGHYSHDSEIDTPINYADYYFLEAMLRYKKAFGEKI
jgi:unsaturated chondroitin disaccharide hydrolase